MKLLANARPQASDHAPSADSDARLGRQLFSVRWLIIAGFGLMILIVVSVVALSAWLFEQHRSEMDHMSEHTRISALLQDAEINGRQSISLMQLYVVSGDPEILEDVGELGVKRSTLVPIEQARDEMASQGRDEGAAEMEAILSRAESIEALWEEVVIARAVQGPEVAAAVFDGLLVEVASLEASFQQAAERERATAADIRAAVDSTADAAFWLLIASGIGGALLAAGVATVVARSVIRPLSRLESAVESVAGGDLTARAPVGGPLEFTRLAQAINNMTDELLDASKRKELEDALRRSEEQFRMIAENATDNVAIIDETGTIEYESPSVKTLFGYEADELLGKNVFEFVHPDDQGRVTTIFADGVKNMRGAVGPVSFRFRHKNGSWRFLESTGSATRSREGKPIAIIHSRDITERKEAERKLWDLNQKLTREHARIDELNASLERKVVARTRDLQLANDKLAERNWELIHARARASTDGLTGLLNHRSFHERLKEAVRVAERDSSSLAVIMMDIDSFKRFNDTRGHLVGDEVLRTFGALMSESVGPNRAYRYGGDEFAVIVPNANERKIAGVANRIRQAVEQAGLERRDHMTISLGVASYPEMADSAEELVYRADMAMYWAKAEGKNQVGFWDKMLAGRGNGSTPWYYSSGFIRAPDAVIALLAALTARDESTAAHTERCSRYTSKLAEALNLDEHERSIVRLSSLLHDIGKLSIDDAILRKPAPLDDKEWAEMKDHSRAALSILSGMPEIAPAVPAILHHHEHFDGTGYPDGLAGDDIPLASRILLVTDAFDAMTTDRPYRRAMPIEAAIDELRNNAGTQFDPEIVEAFLRLLEDDPELPVGFQAAAKESR